ncbi:hypothetical protein M378DRAFT_156358 [Amanita muscaria Koide BX008]|uniref:Uncharacterized protein n=1 Tax=Amanita muscaria (strain Koide BX008) TaxID=946122 RepID=A0A0C2TSJ3_AMAMK|nr:hypothetical protein M378DRAFT_156358 [Amanita muscaria Koide BX008]
MEIRSLTIQRRKSTEGLSSRVSSNITNLEKFPTGDYGNIQRHSPGRHELDYCAYHVTVRERLLNLVDQDTPSVPTNT